MAVAIEWLPVAHADETPYDNPVRPYSRAIFPAAMLVLTRGTVNGLIEPLPSDEPSEGLAPRVVEDLLNQIRQLKEHGLSIVLAEQNLEFVLNLSDYLHILEKGEVKYSGTPEDLRRDDGIGTA